MNSPFKVGDVCIGQHFIKVPERNGMECTIIGPLMFALWIDAHSYQICPSYCYLVQWSDGIIVNIAPENLRRKQPPSDMTQWAASKVKDLLKPVKQGEPA
jgi:hypothetical protein